MVLRTGEILDTEECTRFILPPPVPTFQTYLWYDYEDRRNMSESPRTMSANELAGWYKKYSCSAQNLEAFNSEVRKKKERRSILGQSMGQPAAAILHKQVRAGARRLSVYWFVPWDLRCTRRKCAFLKSVELGCSKRVRSNSLLICPT
jgi:hypothetical protein